jgi:hypothetical protein
MNREESIGKLTGAPVRIADETGVPLAMMLEVIGGLL